MAGYFARKIMEGSQSYSAVFSINIYQKYQEEVDAILAAEGFERLIKEQSKEAKA